MAANVQSLVQYWKNFDLPGLQKDLDFAATDLANRQDESEASRKKLVEQSRDFKRNTSEDVRRTVSPLLKSFQTEVDSLCKRSKAAEAAFLAVYKKVVEAPDPLPALEICLSAQQRAMRTQDLEIENKQLRETLNDYNQEFKDVRNQEVTIKQLRERLKDYEERSETVTQVRAKEKELQRALVEKERQVQETQESLARKLHEAERKIADLQSALECTHTELFDLKSTCDENSHAKSEEMEIVLNDLERANQRAASAEKEVSDLRTQLSTVKRSLQLADQIQQAPDMEQAVGVLARSSLEVELASKEKEIAQLVEDIQRLQTSITTLKETSASQIAQLQDMLSEKNQVIQRLEKQLDKQKDYMEIKQELCILKSMEFPNGERESVTPASSPKPLEVLLLEKTKSLQAENTSLKMANADSSKRCDLLEQERHHLLKTLNTQRDLIAKLELDLANVHVSMFCRGEGEGQSQPSGTQDFLGDIASTLDQGRMSGSASPSPMSGRPKDFPEPADTLLPIISSQRERFRQRNEQLEAENAQLVQQLTTMQTAVSGLQEDNVKLYEKIKFLQSYPSQRSAMKDEMESRYSQQYEEQLDPFTTFSRRERQRKYMNLSPFEKLTLSLGQSVLSNRFARTGAVIYTFILHCLVFLVLYKLAYTETCRRDLAAECHAKFAEHMQLAHGDHL